MAAETADILWRQIKKDQFRSFEKLYQLTHQKLANLCYKILDDEELTKDILQECYVSLYQKKESLPDDLNVEAYLYAAVKYSSFKYLRDVLTKRKSLFVSYDANSDYASTSEDPYQWPPYTNLHQPADILDQGIALAFNPADTEESLIDHVMNSIQELPERCRNAFMLKYFKNMSYREISEQMEISPRTVEKHVHYGLHLLKKKFRKNQILIVILLTRLFM